MPGPQPPGRAELGHLFEQRGPGHEEEREPRPELVHGQPGAQRGAHVLLGVGQRERDLLDRRGTRLGHVVAGDRDGVPARDLGPAVAERVGHQAQRRGGRVDVRAAGDVLLEDVVLDGAGQRGRRHALLLGHQLVEQQQQRGRGVDGHRGGHAVQRDAAEQDAHVLDGVDGHADLAHLAVGQRRVRVVAHLGGQVERHGQAGGARLDQLVVAPVRVLGGGEPGILPHRPGPAGVHPWVHSASERVRPRLPEFFRRVEACWLTGPVHGLDRQPGLRLTSHEPRLRAGYR